MPHSQSPSRLSWLAASLGEQGQRMSGLLRRLAGFSQRDNLNPSVFRKFICMLKEVDAAKEEEALILSEIEGVEKKHRLMRNQKKLKHACDARPDAAYENANGEQPEPQTRSLLWLAALWYLFKGDGIKQSKQDLTPD